LICFDKDFHFSTEPQVWRQGELTFFVKAEPDCACGGLWASIFKSYQDGAYQNLQVVAKLEKKTSQISSF